MDRRASARKSNTDDAERSFAGLMDSLSSDERNKVPGRPEATDSGEQSNATPVQVPIQILPVVTPPPAPLALDIALAQSLPADPDSRMNAPVPAEAETQNAKPERKVPTSHATPNPLPALELLAPEPIPIAPFKVEEPDQPLRPSTPIKPSILAGVAEQNTPKIPGWLASSFAVETDPAPGRIQIQESARPAAKPAPSPEIAFTATIKEVQSVKPQINERAPSDAMQPNFTLAPGSPQKQVTQPQLQAKPIEAAKPADLSAVHPVLNEHPVSTGAVNSISLKVDSQNSGIDVKLIERGGTIQVTVRTPDRELTGDIRGHLNELVDRLSDKGYETRTWTPEVDVSETKRSDQMLHSISSTFQSQNDPRNSNQGEPGKGSANEDSSGGRQSKGEGREQGQQNARQDSREKPKNIFRKFLEGARP